jgi:quercetin dioxygenase-like cupin family protein
MTVSFARLDGLPERPMLPGVYLKILAGDAVMFSIVRFDPQATVPTHQHPHEQIGFVLEGEMDLWIGEQRRHLARGDLYTIPSNVPHGAETQDGTCVVVDVFHPLRDEYVKLFQG